LANLEVAADELVRKLRTVDGELEQAHDRFSELKEKLGTLGDGLDEDWIEVARAVGELVEKAGEELSTLGAEAQETGSAVSGVEGMGQGASEAFTGALDGAETGTNQLADAVTARGPQVDAAAQAGEQMFEALGQQAEQAGEQLAQVLQEARDFLTGEVATALQTMESEIADRFSEMRTTLVEECGGALQTAYDEWSGRLDEVLQAVAEEGFEAAHEQGQEVVEWALSECAKKHDEELDQLLQVAEAVREALNTLQEEVSESTTDVGEEGRNALAQALSETQAALVAMIGAVDTCRQVMSNYSFCQV
jgi:ABC-type transporter Mla subunit MlaD